MPKKFLLSESGDRGWFVGDFPRAVYKTTGVEVAYQINYQGEKHPKHYHKIATEINLILSGHVIMSGEHYRAGEGVVFAPGEICECEYLEDTASVVVKVPGPLNDKYLYAPEHAQINEGQEETASGSQRTTTSELDEP